MDFSGLDGQIDPVKRLYAREDLCDLPHFQKCRHRSFPKETCPHGSNAGRPFGSAYFSWSAV
jgi:hypothetical protein